jgi:hypothetical protein
MQGGFPLLGLGVVVVVVGEPLLLGVCGLLGSVGFERRGFVALFELLGLVDCK